MTAALILVPLAGALVAFLAPGRIRVAAGLLGAVATASFGVFMAGTGAASAAPGGWGAPLGIELHLDHLSVLMLLVMAGVGLVVSVYAAFYGSRPGVAERGTFRYFWPLWLMLWATLNGIFVARDLFTLYVLLETGLLAAAALATLSGTAASTAAALRYLLSAMVGSFAYLMGVVILYNLHGTLDLHVLANVVENGPASGTAILLMTLGLMVKTAVFPLHFWLPAAHASAPAPVSAILSGLVVKGSFVLLLRLWIELGDVVVHFAGGQVLGAAAAGSIVWGSIQALRQTRLKLLIAYSTVAQIGIFFLLFPMLAAVAEVAALEATAVIPEGGASGPERPAGAAGVRAEAWAGGAIHASAHALAKAALFLGSGLVIVHRGTDRLAGMRGIAFGLPLTTAALLLGGLALIGTPLSGAYVGKALLMEATRAGGQWWWTPVLHGATLLSAAYVAAMLRFAVLPRRGVKGDGSTPSDRPVPLWVQALPLALAAGALLMGWHGDVLRDLLLPGDGGGLP